MEEGIRARWQHGGVIFAPLCRIIPERFQRIYDVFLSPDDCLIKKEKAVQLEADNVA